MTLSILSFHKERPRNTFDCGSKPITNWYKNKAKKCVERMEFRVFEAMVDGVSQPVGYYALQIGNESMDAVANKPDDFTKNYAAFPAVHLAFLGVDKPYQRKKIGSALLSDVFDKVYAISECAGVYALTLQSLNENSTRFYESLGFTTYAHHPVSPKMLMPVRTIRDLVIGAKAGA